MSQVAGLSAVNFLRLRAAALALRVLRLRAAALALRVLRLRAAALALRVLKAARCRACASRSQGCAHQLRFRAVALTLRTLRGPPLQYNSAFYARSIGQIQRPIPSFDGADRCRDRRYDRRGNGVSSHSVLRSETARVGNDDWNDHRVILHSSTRFRSGMGPCFRSLWTQARAARRT